MSQQPPTPYGGPPPGQWGPSPPPRPPGGLPVWGQVLIGIGLTTISLAGACALIINGLSEGSV